LGWAKSRACPSAGAPEYQVNLKKNNFAVKGRRMEGWELEIVREKEDSEGEIWIG